MSWQRAVARYPALQGARLSPYGTGLINETFLAQTETARLLVQKVNRIFVPAVADNIEAVTVRLAEAGIVTPRLVDATGGRHCVDLGTDGVWRVMTFMEGVSFEAAAHPAQVRDAGRLIARFHGALRGLSHSFVGMRLGVHDTAAHLRRLGEAVAAHPRHRLSRQVGELATQLQQSAAALPPLPNLPLQICHGDLKFNNILFAAGTGADSARALCLIDLDTVGPMSLAHEMGDALRSWCNRAGENAPEAELDLEIFRAAVEGYREGRGGPLTAREAQALLLGAEWVSLELAARFAADALNESYFGWDAARFASRGDHNLTRAAGQWSCHQALVDSRPARSRWLSGV